MSDNEHTSQSKALEQILKTGNKDDLRKYFQTLEPSKENLQELVNWSLGKIKEVEEEIYFKKLPLQMVVSLSGRDSIVLLDIARKVDPNIRHMFSNTGIEWPSHLKFWKEHYPNLEWFNAKMSQRKAYEMYGAPIVSKEQSLFLKDLRAKKWRHKRPTTIIKRLGGKFSENQATGSFGISHKWLFLADKETFPTEFEYSSKCCDIFKGEVKHNKDMFTLIGTRAEESNSRTVAWRRTGCINYGQNSATPLSLWPEWAIAMYVEENNLALPETYTKLGMRRTGCYSCPFGMLYDQKNNGTNNLRLMYEYYPYLYKHVMTRLGLRNHYIYGGVEVPEDVEYMKEVEEFKKKRQEWYDNLEYNFARILRTIPYEFNMFEMYHMAKTHRMNIILLNR